MIAMLKNTAKEDESGSPAPSDENTETELAKYMSRAKLFKSIEAAYTVLLDLELMVQEELRWVFLDFYLVIRSISQKSWFWDFESSFQILWEGS